MTTTTAITLATTTNATNATNKQIDNPKGSIYLFLIFQLS
jgi:hypothetical protein